MYSISNRYQLERAILIRSSTNIFFLFIKILKRVPTETYENIKILNAPFTLCVNSIEQAFIYIMHASRGEAHLFKLFSFLWQRNESNLSVIFIRKLEA